MVQSGVQGETDLNSDNLRLERVIGLFVDQKLTDDRIQSTRDFRQGNDKTVRK
jgi:hypothetical protein